MNNFKAEVKNMEERLFGRTCSVCGERKDLTEYLEVGNEFDYVCVDCIEEMMKAEAEANPEETYGNEWCNGGVC